MTIRRDNIGAAYPSVQRIAQNVTTTPEIKGSVKAPLYIPVKSEPTTASAEPRIIPSPPSVEVACAVNPIQHQVAQQREAFEKERKLLLRTASNFGGESAERIISDYLAI